MSYNTRRSNSPLPYPLYIWPKPGDDIPRLAWVDWLRLISLEMGTTIPGAPGAFLSQHILAIAEHARVLGATDPDSHERLAQEAADSEAAWVQALEHEAMAPGIWSLTDPDSDSIGGWDGHPADWCEDESQRGYFSTNPHDETYLN